MKISNLILGVSLAANAALVAGFMTGFWNRLPSDAAHGVISTHAPTNATAETEAGAGAASGGEWAALQSDDLATQRDRLRAAGFPPAMIRTIFAAQIREAFAARRKALESTRDDAPYWKAARPDPQALAGLRALQREIQQTLVSLLGPDPENGTAANLQRQLPDLPADKVAQLAAIRDDYAEKRALISDTQGSMIGLSQASGEKVAALTKAMRTEIVAVLTPEELENYDLRTSDIANRLRGSLAGFDPTEQEFRTLFHLQQDLEDRLGPTYGPVPQAELMARRAAQQENVEQIKAALGPDRYADYQKANDFSYQSTQSLVTRLGLPAETTNQVWATQKDIEQRAAAIRGSQALSPADRSQQMAALNDEATAKVTAALGASGLEIYKQNGGAWLQGLQPRPAINAAPIRRQ